MKTEPFSNNRGHLCTSDHVPRHTLGGRNRVRHVSTNVIGYSHTERCGLGVVGDHGA